MHTCPLDGCITLQRMSCEVNRPYSGTNKSRCEQPPVQGRFHRPTWSPRIGTISATSTQTRLLHCCSILSAFLLLSIGEQKILVCEEWHIPLPECCHDACTLLPRCHRNSVVDSCCVVVSALHAKLFFYQQTRCTQPPQHSQHHRPRNTSKYATQHVADGQRGAMSSQAAKVQHSTTAQRSQRTVEKEATQHWIEANEHHHSGCALAAAVGDRCSSFVVVRRSSSVAAAVVV